jgi:hypothetical protein
MIYGFFITITFSIGILLFFCASLQIYKPRNKFFKRFPNLNFKHQIRFIYFQVTKNDEKVIQKETELRDVKEKLEGHEKLVQDLDRQYKQAMEEKNILAEQLQAETELCAEAEEMRAR